MVKDFKRGFTTSVGRVAGPTRRRVDAMDDEDVDRETVKVRKKD